MPKVTKYESRYSTTMLHRYKQKIAFTTSTSLHEKLLKNVLNYCHALLLLRCGNINARRHAHNRPKYIKFVDPHRK